MGVGKESACYETLGYPGQVISTDFQPCISEKSSLDFLLQNLG